MSDRGKPEINQVVQAFTEYIGLAPTPVARQRQYASTLTKVLGTKTNDVVAYAISIQSDPYAPIVTSPKDLYYNLSKVMAYYKRSNEESGAVVQL